MAKKVFAMYLAKEGNPNSDAYAKLDLPASPWELWDALEKVRLQTDDILYMEIEDYYAFEYLAPHLDGLEISLNELNDLAARLATLDEVQGIAFEGLFSMEVQRKTNANGGVITLQDLRDLAVSAKTDCYHVVDAADDAQLGRFYAENGFIPELDGISDGVFEMLDFAGIGRMMRCSENGVFVGSLYVLQDGELTAAPPVQKTLPEKPGYLFRLTLGLHPDIGDDRTVTLILPAAEAELLDAQAQLGTEGWEGVAVIDYDGIIPYAAEFTDLPMELEEFNVLAAAVRDMPSPEKQLPKLKALLEQFEVRDIATAISLTEHLADYVLTPDLSSPQETAIDHLRFMTELKKIYDLSPEDDPAGIPRSDFEKDGYHYTLVDLLRQELPENESRQHTEHVSIESAKKDMESVLALLPQEREFITDDGLMGTLTLRLDTVQVEPSGYGSSTKQLSVKRSYPNLAEQDTQYIPKSIEDGGRTLTLSDIQWQTDNTANMDGYAVGDRFTAVATYTGSATSSYVKGYTVTADYTGTVSRIALNRVRYVAIFEGVPIQFAEPAKTAGAISSLRWSYVLIPVGVVAAAGAGVGGALLVKRRRENADEEETAE